MDLQNLLAQIKTIAVVGLSDKKHRPSFQVASYLKSHGYRIIPVNPNIKTVLGEKSYPSILSIPHTIQVDLVDIFRKSSDVFPHVKEAVERGGVKVVWMQEGVINEQAERYAKEHGIFVVMNVCLMKTHRTIQ